MEKKNYHLICNTHWDREWRWGLRETQDKLVGAMDILTDTMDKDPRYKSFLTDSQTSMIEDYLEIRPERTELVKKLVSDGRLVIGPWYTLPAEYLVSGESLARNLLIGHKMAKDYGKVSKVGYNIFSWGQVSQLPQLYKNFNIDTIFFYRGLDKTKLDKLEFFWESPDGTKALGVTFGSQHRINFWAKVYRPYVVGQNPQGYDREGDGYLFHINDSENADRNYYVDVMNNKADLGNAVAGMKDLADSLYKASTNEQLILQGFDLENPDPIIPDLVEKLNAEIDYGHIEISNLATYVEKLKEALDQANLYEKLDVLYGEMLEEEKVSPEYGPLYAGVFSSRMPIKLANYKAQTELFDKAEPLNAISYMLGGETNNVSTYKASKLICGNQQHDGIGGCHVDRITKSMEERYEESNDFSRTIKRRALKNLISKIDCSNVEKQDMQVVVFNPTNYARSEIITVDIDIPGSVADAIYVGNTQDSHIEIFDEAGNKINSSTLSFHTESIFTYRKVAGNNKMLLTRYKVAMEVKDLKPYGYKKFIAKRVIENQRNIERISNSMNVLENEFVKAKINFDGSLTVLDKKTGEKYDNLNVFVDCGEVGGPLQHIKPPVDERYSTLGRPADIIMVSNSRELATYKVVHKLSIPKEKTLEYYRQIPSGSQLTEHGNFIRSKEHVILEIVTEITLKNNSKAIEIETTVNNNAEDHKLSVSFGTNIASDFMQVDEPLDVVDRPIVFMDSTGWLEEKSVTYPTTSFVHKYDGKRAISLLHKGLTEYEIVNDDEKSFMLTLLRCFDVAGGGAETYRREPLAECLGEQKFSYALSFGKGDYVEEECIQTVNKLRIAPMSVQCTKHEGEMKDSEYSFLSIENENLMVSAMKIGEDNDSVVIRLINMTNEPITSKVNIAKELKTAEKVSIEEELLETLDKDNIVINVGKKEIYTLKVTL